MADESKNNNANNSVRYSVFILGDKFYGLELLSVREVISVPKISSIPSVPQQIMGVFNFRGTIITLMELNKLLGTSNHTVNESNMVIVVENGGLSAGILVDKVVNLIHVKDSEIKSPTGEISPEMSQYFKGYYIEESLGTIFLLNLDKILDSDKLMFGDIS
jgi:purine-binding chemotaxis protein CheW